MIGEKIDSVRSGGGPVVVGLDEDDHKEVGSIRYLTTMTIVSGSIGSVV